jgi:iron(III) transport system permease protein
LRSRAVPLAREKTQIHVSGKGAATRRAIKSRRSQIIAAVLATITVIVLVLPHLMIILVSFAVDGAWTTQVMPPEYTLDNYRRLFSEAELWRPMVNSLSMAVIATARISLSALLLRI